MHVPRLPDWLIYLAVVVALAMAAVGRQERADAPPAPPPYVGPPVALGSAQAFAASSAIATPTATPHVGTAFSVGDGGVWVTAEHVVRGCARAAILVAPGRGVAADISPLATDDTAILTTKGGAPALPLLPVGKLQNGMRGFHPGYPGDGPGEVTSRLVGLGALVAKGRGARPEPVLVWAQVGRTSGQSGSLAGLSGAPVLDGQGRVVGVTIAEAPRRGRIYSTTPGALRAALGFAKIAAPPDAAGEAITTDNYGRVADDLRRDLRVAQVVCMAD